MEVGGGRPGDDRNPSGTSVAAARSDAATRAAVWEGRQEPGQEMTVTRAPAIGANLRGLPGGLYKTLR